MANRVAELMSLAETTLKALQSSDPEAVLRVAEYCDLVDRYLAEAPGKENTPKEDLERLVTLHQEVLEKAASTQGEISKRLRTLKIRGRGIRAYAGPIPSRISVRRPKKG